MRKTKVTRIIVATRRTVIVRKSGGSSDADTPMPADARDAGCDNQGAIEPRKENRKNE